MRSWPPTRPSFRRRQKRSTYLWARRCRSTAGARNRERLLSLLMPVQRAAEQCPWLKAMVEAGDIYHPLRWTPAEAVQFLKDVPQLESAGVIVRMPATWRMNRPARPQVKATVGGRAPAQARPRCVLDFDMAVILDGEPLTAAEIKALLAHSDGLAFIRGKWVEVDHDRLARTLAQFQEIERRAADDGLSFGEAMRLLAGAGIGGDAKAKAARPIGRRRSPAPGSPRRWQLCAAARRGREPTRERRSMATLRPYQQAGVAWLHLLAKLGLGRLPRRRHGARQDHPGPCAAARSQAPRPGRP